MISRREWAAMTGAAVVVLAPQIGAAQEATCITERDVAAIVTYAMPSAIEAVQNRCGAELAADGFLATGSAAMVESYRVLQDRAWPNAKAGVLLIASDGEAEGEDEATAMMASLPDEALRPLVDALIIQELAGAIPLQDCRKVERGLEAVSPIEPEVATNLVAVLFSLAGVNEPGICPV